MTFARPAPAARRTVARNPQLGVALAVTAALTLVAAATLASAAVPPPAPVTRALTLTATADTYTRTGDRASHGRQDRAYAIAGRATAYTRFPAPHLPAGAALNAASLRIYAAAAAPGARPLAVRGTEPAWTENTLTGTSRPPRATGSSTALLPETGSYTDVDVPIAVRTLTAGASFALTETATPGRWHRAGTTGWQLGTRESAHPAQLVITYTTPAVPRPSADPTPTGTASASPTADPPPSPATSAPSSPTPAASTAPPVPGPLPFDLPAAARTASASKLVFAHYFTPYPVSLDNADAAADYYTRNYLAPGGESGAHSAYGGLLRDRPLPRSQRTGDWRAADMETEVRQATEAGIDGFSVDILSYNTANWDSDLRLLDAAHTANPDFKIMLMPDMNGSLKSLDATTFATMLATAAAKPAAFHLADGRLVVSAFKAENKTPDWWAQVFADLNTRYSIDVAFVPTFLDWRANASAFAPISYGFGNWGARNPAANSNVAASAADAHKLGKLWMQPVSVQDERPNQGIYDEAANTENLRTTWQGAIDGNADWVQLTTWNDYSEGTAFAPSTGHGWSYLDLSDYYLARYKTGQWPAIVRDGLYLTHRTQTAAALPQWPETKLMKLRTGSTPARDTVEVTAFLTAPATITAHVGTSTYTYPAPAGFSTHLAPLDVGQLAAVAARDGAPVAAVTSPFQVTAVPAVQDLQYHATSSLR